MTFLRLSSHLIPRSLILNAHLKFDMQPLWTGDSVIVLPTYGAKVDDFDDRLSAAVTSSSKVRAFDCSGGAVCLEASLLTETVLRSMPRFSSLVTATVDVICASILAPCLHAGQDSREVAFGCPLINWCKAKFLYASRVYYYYYYCRCLSWLFCLICDMTYSQDRVE